MYRLRLPAVAFFVLLVVMALAACSGAAPAAAPSGNTFPDSGSQADGSDKQGEQPAPGDSPAPDQQLIVYTGSIDLEVADLRAAVEQAEQLVVGLGGHVASSSAQDKSGSQYATVTYRIPAEHWSDALAGVKALGTRVVTESTESEDVTAQVIDLGARIANLQATEAQLQSIMDRATTIDEVLKVQRELTTVRGDIESMTAERDHLANQAALATLSVTFEVPVAATSRASEGWDLGQEVDNAVATLVRLGQAAVSLLVWLLIVVAPIVVPIALVIYIAVRIRRRWIASHPRPEPPAPPAAPTIPPPGPWSQSV